MNLPNALTVLRMLLIPVFAYAYYRIGPILALAVFVLASLTDWLDGYLARKWNQITAFGKLADPLADKLMLLTALFCLADTGYIPWWVLLVMAGKELLMVTGSLFLLSKRVVVFSNMLGKTATALFMVAIAMLFPWHEPNLLSTVGQVCLYAALALSVAALIVYAWKTFAPEEKA